MRVRLLLLIVMIWTSLVAGTGAALATSISIPGDFTLELSNGDFGFSDLETEFGVVRNFSFAIDVAGPLATGRLYQNEDILDVRYLVRGSLNVNPPTPSGFSAFFLSRLESGEGTITPEEWANQGSRFAFKISQSANVLDGIQLSELQPLGKDGTILTIDAREFKRLDRARYHPPQLLLNADGTGTLQNSNNSSGSTGTVNPATREPVDVDFGEEYITRLRFDPSAITIIAAPPPGTVVPEPGTALLLGLGLAGMAGLRRGECRAQPESLHPAPAK